MPCACASKNHSITPLNGETAQFFLMIRGETASGSSRYLLLIQCSGACAVVPAALLARQLNPILNPRAQMTDVLVLMGRTRGEECSCDSCPTPASPGLKSKRFIVSPLFISPLPPLFSSSSSLLLNQRSERALIRLDGRRDVRDW